MSVLPETESINYEDVGLTEFAQAMPDGYKVTGDAVAAYRNFYRGDKLSFTRWTKRKMPAWL